MLIGLTTDMNIRNYKGSLKKAIVSKFFYSTPKSLIDKLEILGLSKGEVLFVHSSWQKNNGFSGTPAEFIKAIQSVITQSGVLMMPSLTYQNESTKAFLERDGVLNVRRSPSRMGLLTEVFRRNREVRRSLSPTHSILAWGGRAEEFLRDHEKAEVPFGRGTPFEKLLQENGKILTVDAPFSTITFTHFLEDRISTMLPFPLYEEAVRQGVTIDYAGNRINVPVKVISDRANELRREKRLVDELESRRLIRRRRVGNIQLLLLNAKDMTDCVDRMVEKGNLFFDSPESN